jgi:hypothetical protein
MKTMEALMSKKDTHPVTDRTPHISCLAAYLYRAEPWEAFLNEAVAPFVREIMSKKLADRYFFIRYWEHGPHIRLRFFGDEATLENTVKPMLIAHFESYFQKNPSTRNDQLPPDMEGQYFLHKNDSVVFTEYEPETERYGGTHAIAIAEEHFEQCSDAVLATMSGSDDWNYERALGAAIQLHLGFAFATGMDKEEAAEFYTLIFRGWLPRAFYTGIPMSPEEVAQKRDETLAAFAHNFERQKEVLVEFFQELWQAFENQEEFEEPWLNNWLEHMSGVNKRLTALQETGRLIVPEGAFFEEELKTARRRQELWAVYSSYVHMINNRLGILNRDEGYLGYLIKESLWA